MTLIEVMMSFILVAIGAALAFPSYREMVEKRELTNAAEQVFSFVNATQGIASRTNRDVVLTYTYVDKDEWCIGASTTRAFCDCTQSSACQIDGQDYVLDQGVSNGSELVNAISGNDTNRTFLFDPVRGMFYHFTPATSPDINLQPNDPFTLEMQSDSGGFKLNLVMNATGQVILCSNGADYAIPGYELCPVEEEVQEEVAL